MTINMTDLVASSNAQQISQIKDAAKLVPQTKTDNTAAALLKAKSTAAHMGLEVSSSGIVSSPVVDTRKLDPQSVQQRAQQVTNFLNTPEGKILAALSAS